MNLVVSEASITDINHSHYKWGQGYRDVTYTGMQIMDIKKRQSNDTEMAQTLYIYNNLQAKKI